MAKASMTFAVEFWTPDRAAVALGQLTESGVTQRKRRKGMVTRYARDMRCGGWKLTHQAIAFGPNGDLIDGQHRLAAVVESGCSQEFLTVRYQSGGASAAALATTDIGGKRTVAEVLSISGTLDQDGARDVVAVVTALRMLLDPAARPDASPEEVRGAYSAHETAILWAVKALPRKGYAAPVRAAFAFARSVFPEKTEEFAALITSGEAPRGSAAQTWHRQSANGGFAVMGGGAIRVQVMLRALRLIRAHVSGEGDLTKVYSTQRESLDWFKAKMRKRPVLVALAAAAE